MKTTHEIAAELLAGPDVQMEMKRRYPKGISETTFESFPIGGVGFVMPACSAKWGWVLGYRMSQNFWKTEDGAQMRIENGDRFLALDKP